jgi:vancomycin resistance protein YoaR
MSNVGRMWTARGAERRIALPVKWDKAQLRRKMWIVANNYRVEGRDAGLQVVNGEVQIIPEVEGRAINVGDTLQKLQQRYYVGLPATTATVRNVQPRLTAADLEGKDIKMADYTTRFDAGIRGRTTNIRLVARAVDGQVVMPGETFSFNATTGERTAAKGYRIAHIFVRKPGAAEAEVVEGLGGGTCQVSSTLFNAVRKANKKNGKHLKIVERNTHSLPVTYVPTGLDATVAWPYKDFRFRNKFPHPIYLRTAVSRSHLTISVWGRVPDSMDSNSVIADPTDPERHAENF